MNTVLTEGRKRKPLTKRFICDLYNTYATAYGNTPNAKSRTLEKVKQVANLSRATVYKVLKEARDRGNLTSSETIQSRRKWATGMSDPIVKQIKNKVLSLSASNNGHVSVRRIYAEVTKAELFIGSKGSLHKLLQQMGFIYRKCGDRWKLVLKNKNPINEQLNLDQNEFDFLIPTMMEVKHSPAAQMEFRSSRNGLPEEEEEDLDTLFDEDVGKSLTPSSNKCNTKAPVLNGIIKHSEVMSPAEILDGMEIDLIKDDVDSNDDKPASAENAEAKKENEEAEGAKSDLDMLDLDLETESTEKTENGEVTDSSKVRDTGDDLDTLLSKINDLVEDCMEPKAVGVASTIEDKDDDVVEIPDDDMDDVTDEPTSSPIEEVRAKVQPVAKEDVKAETELEAEVQAEARVKPEAAVADLAPTASKQVPTEKMDIDHELLDSCDDIVCLDSPLPPEPDDKEEEDELLIEEALHRALNSNPDETEKTIEVEPVDKTEKEEEVVTKPAESQEKTVPEEPKPMEDDEIYLIEDDDDDGDEPMKATDPPAKAEDEVEEPKKIEEKEPQMEVVEASKPAEEEQKTKVSSEDKPSINNEEDDDDIVCLDDSIEEVDEKEDEAKEDTNMKPEEKQTDDGKEEQDSEKVVEKVAEAVTEKVEETVIEKVVEEILNKEPEKEILEKEKVEEEVLEVEATKKVEETVEASSDIPIEEKKAPSEPEKSSNTNLDDDIVILDDDDDEDEAPPFAATEKKDEKSLDSDKKSPTSPAEEEKKIEEKSTSDDATTVKPSTILSDNSDNARDGVDEKEENVEVKAKTPLPSESNSCSSSSNLLKEAANDGREVRDENSEQPPAKRIRLSQDEASSRHSTASQEDTKSNTVDDDEVMEVIVKGDEDTKSLKRVHSTESVSSDFKKPKTDEEIVKVEEVEPEVVPKKVEVKPLALYPPPKLETPTIDLSLDFLKRFKKSIHKMNKSDLEELVLQKIVEAIVHKSEFSEMRDLIEKQEKIISGHRTKITELNKQFRDLEMVHNRVLKDLETKNSQFIMPVKITRAVGLQVFFPSKKYDQPLVPPSSIPVQPPPASTSRSVSSSSTTSGSTPVTPSTSCCIPPAVVQQQPPVQRRGCVQKLTPMRPDTPRNSPLNRGVTTDTVSSSTPSPAVAKEASSSSSVKILNRTLAPKNRLNSPSQITNVIPTSSLSTVVAQPVLAPMPAAPAEKPKSTVVPLGIATKKPNIAVKPLDVSQRYKKLPNPRQSDPQTIAQPLPAAATVVATPLPPCSTGSTTMASKPPNKSVIDLTDEDDVVPPPVTTKSPRTPAAAAVAPAVPAPTIPSANPTPNRGQYKVSVVPQNQLLAKPNPPKQTPQRPIAPILPKPNGASISIRPAPVNTRYRHPAPLPNQPIHSSNPAWKLPPARPTIRISNLDSGIVISWTIEDAAKEKYAESTSYQIYAYQETSGPPLVESWRHVGDVKAMLLPMAVTLTQFQEGQRYYFAVRAVDAHNRCGPFSFAKTWS